MIIGEVFYICIIIYDVIDEVVNKKELEEVNSKFE